jgi:Mpv17-like protein
MAAILKATQNMFKKHPLVSNMVVYGSLYVGAEFSQQMLTRKWQVKAFPLNGYPVFQNCSFSQETEPVQDIDRKALGRYAIMGTFILSPGLYAWYKWLDGKFVGTTKRIVFKKLMLDQFLMTPPLLATFFIGNGVLRNLCFSP